jgi:hypothetical protein
MLSGRRQKASLTKRLEQVGRQQPGAWLGLDRAAHSVQAGSGGTFVELGAVVGIPASAEWSLAPVF